MDTWVGFVIFVLVLVTGWLLYKSFTEKTNGTNEQLTARVSKLEARLATTVTQLEAVDGRTTRFAEALSNVDTHLKTNTQELGRVRDGLKTTSALVAQLETKSDHTDTVLDRVSKLATTASSNAESAKSQAFGASTKVAEVRTALDQQIPKIETANNNANSAKAEALAANQKVTTLEPKLDSLDQEVQTAIASSGEAQTRARAAQTVATEAKSDAESANKVAVDARTRASAASNQVDSLKLVVSQVQQTANDSKILASNLQSLTSDYASVRSQATGASVRSTQNQTRLETAEPKIQSQALQLGKVEANVEAVNTRAKAAATSAAAAMSKTIELSKEIESLEAERPKFEATSALAAATRDKVAVLEPKVETVVQILDTTTEIVAETSATLGTLKGTVATLDDGLAKTKILAQGTQAGLEKQTTILNRATVDLGQTKTLAEKNRADLLDVDKVLPAVLNSLSATTELVTETEAKFSKFKTSTEAGLGQLKVTTDLANQATAKLKVLEPKVSTLETGFAKSTAQVNQVSQAVNELGAQVQSQSTELGNVAGDLKQTNGRVTTLAGSITAFETSVGSLQSAVGKLGTDVRTNKVSADGTATVATSNKAKLEKFEKDQATFTKNLDTKLGPLLPLPGTVSSLDARTKNVEAGVGANKKLIEDTQAQVKILNTGSTATNKKLNATAEDLKKVEVLAKATQATTATLTGRATTLENNLTAAQAELGSATKDLSVLNKNFTESTAEFLRKFTAQDQKFEMAERRADVTQGQVAKNSERIETETRELGSVRGMLFENLRRTTRIETSAKRSAVRLDELDPRFKASMDQIQNLETAAQSSRAKIARLDTWADPYAITFGFMNCYGGAYTLDQIQTKIQDHFFVALSLNFHYLKKLSVGRLRFELTLGGLNVGVYELKANSYEPIQPGLMIKERDGDYVFACVFWDPAISNLSWSAVFSKSKNESASKTKAYVDLQFGISGVLRVALGVFCSFDGSAQYADLDLVEDYLSRLRTFTQGQESRVGLAVGQLPTVSSWERFPSREQTGAAVGALTLNVTRPGLFVPGAQHVYTGLTLDPSKCSLRGRI